MKPSKDQQKRYQEQVDMFHRHMQALVGNANRKTRFKNWLQTEKGQGK